MPLLEIIVKSLENFNAGFASTSSYYVTVLFSGEKLKTKTAGNSANPIWNENVKFFFEHDQLKGGSILFLLKRTSFFPLPKKKRVICWCELRRDTVLHLEEKWQIFSLRLIDNSSGNASGILNIACRIGDYSILGGKRINTFEEDQKNGLNTWYFVIDVYHAEYLPRSDFGYFAHCRSPFGLNTESSGRLVDPYLVITFADEVVSTNVIEKTANPNWMQRLSLPFKIPPRDVSLRLELKDRDLIGLDDLIATSFLTVIQMTANGGTGLLPCFGPTYINFYGSSRKFITFENQGSIAMNSGQVEGCAFKGRVLLQVTTVLGVIHSASNGFEEIQMEMVEKSPIFLKNQTCIIRVTFLECYFVRDGNPKYIEVSIGPFGDSTVQCKHCIRGSSIPPFVPVQIFMKNASQSSAYSTSWTDKPCVIFTVPLESSSISNIVISNAINNLRNKLMEILKLFDLSDSETSKSNDFESSIIDFATACQLVMDHEMDSNYLTDIDVEIHKIFLKCLRLFKKQTSRTTSQVGVNGQVIQTWKRNKTMMLDFLEVLDRLKSTIHSSIPDIFVWLCDCNTNERLAYIRVPAAEIWYEENLHLIGASCDVTTSFALKYPHGICTFENPGEIRIRIWLGDEKYFDSCLKTRNNTEKYIFYAERFQRTDRGCTKWKPSLVNSWWSDILGKKRMNVKDIKGMQHWSSEGQWFIDSGNASLEKNSSDLDNSSQDRTIETTAPIEKEIIVNETNTDDRATDESYIVNLFKSGSVEKYIKWRQKMTSNSSESISSLKLIKSTVHPFRFSCPTLYLHFTEQYFYVLRVQIYQAKNLLAGDKTGLSDPFVRIIFAGQGSETRTFPESVCPVWDECLILEKVIIPGPNYFNDFLIDQRDGRFTDVPHVIVELYDYDSPDETNFLGGTSFAPHLPSVIPSTQEDILSWKTLFLGNKLAGELLIGAELTPWISERMSDDSHTIHPSSIRPKLQRSVLEIFCFRLSDLKEQVQPFIEFLCFDINPIATTDVLSEFPMFSHFQLNHFIIEMIFPANDAYLPSLTIRLKEMGHFGRISTIGGATLDLCNLISSSMNFGCSSDDFNKQKKTSGDTSDSIVVDILTVIEQHPKNQEKTVKDFKDLSENESLDWWSQYYASKREYAKCGEFLLKGYRTLIIYDSSLEETEPYKTSLKLIHNVQVYKGMSLVCNPNQMIVAELKLAVGLHRYEETNSESGAFDRDKRNNKPLSNNLFRRMAKKSLEVESVLVRLYIIRARNLVPKDILGLADPYVRVKTGNDDIEVPDTLHHNTLEPIFGRVFESTLRWPGTPQMLIKLMDRDILGRDDMIGQTAVDLEERFLLSTICHSNCGVAKQYLLNGPYNWRDMETPKEILEAICESRGSNKPIYPDLQNKKFGKFEKHEEQLVDEERIALDILHKMNLVVPQHIETRKLYHPSSPGVAQGDLEMWIDIFPINQNNSGPPVVDVSPRTPKPYVLRCVIYNAYDVLLDEHNILGDEMSDVYVEGWLEGLESSKQKTDVHYRCLSGEANFNWRFVLPFDFIPGENVLVQKVRSRFTDVHRTEVSQAPVFRLRIFDYDVFSRDDPLGTLELLLLEMTPPLLRLKDFDKQKKSDGKATQNVTLNLFKHKFIRGFWPCVSLDGEEIVGKLELELELLTLEESELRPAGQGRSEPNANPVLVKPSRPSDSFSWITSPLKALKYIIWPKLRWKCTIVFLVVISALLIYSIGKWFLDALVHKWVYNL